MSDWNGQRRSVDYWIKVLSEPDKRPALREELAAVRRRRIYDSLLTRPVFVPLTFSMNAAGQVIPYRQITPDLGYDVVITGMRTDCWVGSGRDIEMRLTDDEGSQPFVRIGDDTTLYLRTDDIMGCSVDAGGGQVGVFRLPQPVLLNRGNRVAIEMYKTDTTAAAEVVNVVLIGFRVLPRAYAETALDIDEQRLIDSIIARRDVWQTRTQKVAVTYSAATVGIQATNITFPRIEEPILLRGLRTPMRQSTIEIGIEGEANWMPSQVPIWAVAAENDLGSDNYLWFSRPVFVHSQRGVVIPRMINGNIDQSNVDPTTNQITIIYDTV